MKFSEIPYNRPDFEKLFSDMDSAVSDCENASSAKGQIAALDRALSIMDIFNTEYALVRIRYLLNTKDEFYHGEQKLFSTHSPTLTLKFNKIRSNIIKSPFKAEIERTIGSVAMKNYTLFNSTISSDIVEDMREESALVAEYVGVISKLTVDFDGKTLPLSMLAPYKESPDRDQRKRAFEAEGKVYASVKAKLDEIFDKLVKNRTSQAKKLGFENYVELGYARMGRNCYTSKDVNIFKNQVAESIVPLVDKIIENRKNRLELGDIFFHDLLLPFKDGAPKPQVSADEIIENGRKLYHEMSPMTADFIDLMIDNELIDWAASIGKSPGGFCSYIKKYNYPFIFANFNGTSTDLYVLTHEAGHALSRYITGLKNEVVYASTSMDISETHSMAMEFLTSPWYELFFKEKADKYRQSHGENALIFIPYACQVDQFQEEIYLNPDLTPKERDEKWLEIEQKFRPYVSYDGIPFYGEGAGWQKQTHIYKTPFYYIDYALAQIMAIQFFSIFLHDQDKAFELYFKLISYGSKKTFTELIEALNMSSPLQENTVRQVVIDLFDKLN